MTFEVKIFHKYVWSCHELSHIVLLILVMPHLLYEMKSFLYNLFIALLKPQRCYVWGSQVTCHTCLCFLTICSSLKYKIGDSMALHVLKLSVPLFCFVFVLFLYFLIFLICINLWYCAAHISHATILPLGFGFYFFGWWITCNICFVSTILLTHYKDHVSHPIGPCHWVQFFTQKWEKLVENTVMPMWLLAQVGNLSISSPIRGP